MRKHIAVGTMAGLIAAAVPGVLLQLMTPSLPGGTRTSMMVMAARVVRSNHPLVGWLVVLVYGVMLGMLFGWLARERTLTAGLAIVAGVFYGAGWWILSGLVVVPALLGLVPLSPAAVDVMRPVALRTMLVSVLYGGGLGVAATAMAEWLSPSRSKHPGQESRRAA